MSKKDISLILGYRSRGDDLPRLERCLKSLQTQTDSDFSVLLVDYGSEPADSNKVQALLSAYDFCQYVYTDTRGYAWNRSHALNVGLRTVQADYVAFSDIDMVFRPNFFEILKQNISDEVLVLCDQLEVPKDYDRWERIAQDEGKFESRKKSAPGGFMCAAREKLLEINGFDEFYRCWGREDKDLLARAKKYGLKEMWLDDAMSLYNQCNADLEHNYQLQLSDQVWGRYVPESVWRELCTHFFCESDELVRNKDKEWGKVFFEENRPILEKIDLDSMNLKTDEGITHLSLPVYDHTSLFYFLEEFEKLKSGEVIALDNACYPNKTLGLTKLINWLNHFLGSKAHGPRINYQTNLLHSFVECLIFRDRGKIADYYLNLPVKNGLTLILKA